MRLLNQAFKDEPRMISPEVPVSIYRIDMVLDLKQRNLFNIALEVSNALTKHFRTGYPTPTDRIRTKVLEKHGFKPVIIDTDILKGF